MINDNKILKFNKNKNKMDFFYHCVECGCEGFMEELIDNEKGCDECNRLEKYNIKIGNLFNELIKLNNDELASLFAMLNPFSLEGLIKIANEVKTDHLIIYEINYIQKHGNGRSSWEKCHIKGQSFGEVEAKFLEENPNAEISSISWN